MQFRDCLKKYNIYKRIIILIKIWWIKIESEKSNRMHYNLLQETRLESHDWERLVNKLIESSWGRDEMKQIIVEFCRDDRSLLGPEIDIPSNTALGRVVRFDDFINSMKDIKIGLSRGAIEAKIRSHLFITSAEKYPFGWGNNYIAKYILWATLRPGSLEPFGNPLPNKDTILCMLGLEHSPSSLLLFEYYLPNHISGHIPTFCDAYAASDWNPYFKVAPPHSEYGFTDSPSYCKDIKGYPEIVHNKILFKHLKKKMGQIL